VLFGEAANSRLCWQERGVSLLRTRVSDLRTTVSLLRQVFLGNFFEKRGRIPISVYLAKHRNTDKLKGWEGKKRDLSGCCQ
jgi:hypothetical protein